MRRSGLAPVLLGALVVLVAGAVLVPTQAPSRDEVHTLQQVRDRSFSSLVDEIPSTADRSPPAYYVAMWAATPLTGGDIVPMRAVSVAAWVGAAVLLGLIVRRRGAPWPAVLAATVAPTATGLGAMGSYARPYALCFAALCVLLEAWDASLRQTSTARLVRVLVAGSVAVALNYLALLAIGCVLVAELLARRRRPGRGPAPSVALAATALPAVVSLPLILRSVDALRDLPREVAARSFPGWYASVLGPLVPGLAILGAIGLVAWCRADRPPAVPARSRLRRAASAVTAQPLLVASVLLVAVLPSAVILATWVSSGAYLHRYAIGGLAGVAVLVGAAVTQLHAWRRWAGVLAVGLVLASVPIAVARSVDDRLAASTARDLSADLGLGAVSDPIAVSDEYVFVLLQQDAPDAVADRTVLAGPATFHGLDPRYVLDDLREPNRAPDLPDGPFVVVADAAELDELAATGRIEVLDRLGTARVRYATTDRTLVAARVQATIP